MRLPRRARRRADPPIEDTELDEARPYLDLAREIQAEVQRLAADPVAQGQALIEFLDGLPRHERSELARRVFGELPAERQWEVIAAAYGDEEIRAYLAAERDERLGEVQAGRARLDRARAARQARALDTRQLPPDELLTLGLFRERDVRAGLARGRASSSCARRLVLLAVGDGAFRVIEDGFNPNGGYFVTEEYSEDTWRRGDRLAGHTIVRVGSVTASSAGSRFEPIVYPGGRVDFEVGGRAVRGHLHLGFAMLGDVDIFAD